MMMMMMMMSIMIMMMMVMAMMIIIYVSYSLSHLVLFYDSTAHIGMDLPIHLLEYYRLQFSNAE